MGIPGNQMVEHSAGVGFARISAASDFGIRADTAVNCGEGWGWGGG